MRALSSTLLVLLATALPLGRSEAQRVFGPGPDAYTLPRERENSRVKDLPDLALLASAGELDAERVRRAIQQTFEHRKTHPAPTALPAPPPAWAEPYKTIAEEDGLPWKDLDDVTSAARSFLDPVLAASSSSTWSPSTWTWGEQP